MANERTVILHHYQASPFAQKVRLALSLKRIPWASVTVPVIAPKPDLAALTGGYRRVPVMQVGADIYVDTRLILEELERRYPLQALALPGHEGFSSMVSVWTDRVWFPLTASIVFGEVGERMPEAFREDRARMMGRPFDVAKMKAAAPMLREQWVAHLGWIEQRLAGARGAGAGEFLVASKPGLVDVHASFNIWFARAHLPEFVAEVLALHPLTAEWDERLTAEADGPEPETVSPEQAIEIARDAAPRLVSVTSGYEPRGLKPGDRIAVAPDDYAQDWVEGTLVHSDPQRIILKRFDARAETIHVHFPRAGYHVKRLDETIP
jgi:glutathione S-transferase